MKFLSLSEWLQQLQVEYPYAVRVSNYTPDMANHMAAWCMQHVGKSYHTWVNEHPTYRFKRESDAVLFSLMFT
jgi:uncharacterized protein YycO